MRESEALLPPEVELYAGENGKKLWREPTIVEQQVQGLVAGSGVIVYESFPQMFPPTTSVSVAEVKIVWDRPLPDLTPRELQVYKLIAQGKTQFQVGRVLKITENTVKGHVVRILRRFGLESAEQAVYIGARIGLIDSEEILKGYDLNKINYLSPRRKEVLGVLADTSSFQCGNKGVARRLGISENTVKNHITRILLDLGVDTRILAGLIYIFADKKGLLLPVDVSALPLQQIKFLDLLAKGFSVRDAEEVLRAGDSREVSLRTVVKRLRARTFAQAVFAAIDKRILKVEVFGFGLLSLLSPEEIELLDCIVSNNGVMYNNVNLARHLRLRPEQIAVRIEDICFKLDVENKIQAASRYLATKLQIRGVE